MTTIRDHIEAQPSVPDPPPGATHVLSWEGFGSRRWELLSLDDSPGVSGPALNGSAADTSPAELERFASGLLGCPVTLSARVEIEDEAGYYVTPAGGDR